MGDHALLSASGAHKWMNCTPSARLEETMPESTSTYADEGRLAHEIAELKLRKQFTEPMGLRSYNSKLKKLQENKLYSPEMLVYTDAYLDYISGLVHSFQSRPYIAVEKKLDFSAYVNEGFGTGDCIVIGDNTLYVIDLKYGKGVPVFAETNPQMMLYALGAYEAYSFLYNIEKIKMVIIQPRLDNISEFKVDVFDLIEWGEFIKPIAQKAFAGEGEFVSGEHCRFCRAKAKCRARSEFNLQIQDYKGLKPPLISNEEVGQILLKAKDLSKWISDLEEHALSECLAGNEVPGWKAVEGRSVRQFKDSDMAFNTLMQNGIEETMLYERKPITLTGVEKMLGKAKFNELLAEQVNIPKGEPSLVPASDKREPFKRSSAAEEFKEVSNEDFARLLEENKDLPY